MSTATANDDTIHWIVKTMSGKILGKFDSHESACKATEQREIEPARYSEWCQDLRIIRTARGTAPLPPFTYDGGNLGLVRSNKPSIYFYDAIGKRWLTHSVEYVLRNVDQFTGGRGPDQLLAAAALHYGLDAWALINGRPGQST